MPATEHKGASGRVIVIAGALCMIAGLEFFLAEWIAAAGWPDYSYATLDISLLGAVTCGPYPDAQAADAIHICSPRHAAMNAGFVLVGLLHLAGVVLTWTIWPRTWLSWIALSALAAGAIGAAIVGLAPLDQNHGLHIVGAAFGLLVGNVGLVLLGLSLIRRAPAFGLLSVVCGSVALAGFALYRSGSYLGLGGGGMERVAAYPETLWYAVAGVVLIVGAMRKSDDRGAAERQKRRRPHGRGSGTFFRCALQFSARAPWARSSARRWSGAARRSCSSTSGKRWSRRSSGRG